MNSVIGDTFCLVEEGEGVIGEDSAERFCLVEVAEEVTDVVDIVGLLLLFDEWLFVVYRCFNKPDNGWTLLLSLLVIIARALIRCPWIEYVGNVRSYGSKGSNSRYPSLCKCNF